MNTKEITIRQNAKRIRAEILCDAIDIEDILTRALGDLKTVFHNSFAWNRYQIYK